MVKSHPEVRKGDVVWAPYRREPLWPALAVRALTLNDVLPSTSKNDLREAYSFAKQYLKERELTRGSAAPLYYVGVYPRELGSGDDCLEDDSIDTYDDMSTIADDVYADTGSTASTSEEKSRSEDWPAEEYVGISEKDKAVASNMAIKRKHSSDDPSYLAKRQPLSQSSLESSAFAADSTTHSDTSPSPDLLAPTIFREATYILERIWTTDLVQNYVTPPRSSMRFETCTGNLLSDHETDTLFDLIFTWVRERERDSYFLPGVHLVLNVLMPEVIIQALEIAHGLSRDVAERMVRRTRSENSASSGSSTSGELNCSKCRGVSTNNGLV